MKEIRVIPKTEKGEEAIQNHMITQKNISRTRLKVFRMLGFKESLNLKPTFLILTINNAVLGKYLTKEQVTGLMNDEFKTCGAIEGTDYTYEVTE